MKRRRRLQTSLNQPLGVEDAVLLEAYNRVLGEDVVSTLDIPPFNRSTVDGYAVKAQDIVGADENQPANLQVVGVVGAGEQPKLVLAKGEAVEIVTGAPLPEGADAAVMVEDTEREDGELHVFTTVAVNANVMKRGSDIKKGEAILKKGQVLGSSEIGVLAALGLTKAKVLKIPIVAVLSTAEK